MTNQTPKSERDSDDDSRDRWEYDGEGTGRAGHEIFEAGLHDNPTTVAVYPVLNPKVHLGIIVGDGTGGEPYVSALIHLSPDDAESLARDLIHSAAEAREAQADE